MENWQSKAELIASSLGAMLMFIVTIWIVLEAIERLNVPRPVTGIYVVLIEFYGLVVNLVVAKKLHRHCGDQHNKHHHET